MKYSIKIMMLCTWSMLFNVSFVMTAQQGRLRTLFGKQKHTETTTKEYALQNSKGITITNFHGQITIASEWKQPTITVESIKMTQAPDQLAEIGINEKRLPNGDIELSVDSCPKKCSIDLVLIVPAKVKLKLATKTGDIITQHIQGEIFATTQKGAINLHNTSGCVIAETQKNGSIRISQANGNVKATTEKGSIYLYDTTESIIATTQKGSINVSCKKLPTTGKLNALSRSGSIDIKLPHEVNADLIATTKLGTVVCDHPVTIKPFTTPWNKNAWKHLKHEICGTLGTGEATITLHNQRGNIKIRKLT